VIQNRKVTQSFVAHWLRAGIVLGGLVFGFGALQGCSPTGGIVPPTGSLMTAEVAVVSDPAGGMGVSSISCTFEVVEVPSSTSSLIATSAEPAPITVRADWTASCGVHKSETFTFTGGTETFITNYEDPGGYPLTMNFWVAVSWVDARGSHVVRSATANVTTGSSGSGSGGGCTM